MAEILILIAAIILIILGFAGCILPVIPGPPISFLGLFILKYTHYVEASNMDVFTKHLWILAAAAIIVTILDYIVPVWGTKKFGGSKYGSWGAGIGLIAGLILGGPVGIIIGPFLGALIGELIAGKNKSESFRSAFGSFLGFLTGVLLKLIVSGIISFYFVKEIFV